MSRKVSLAFRLSLFLGMFVAVILTIAIAVIGTRLDASIRALVRDENGQIAAARAAELGQILEKIFWQLRVVVADPELAGASPSGPDEKSAATAVYSLKQLTPTEVIGHIFAWPDGRTFTSSGSRGDASGEAWFRSLAGGETAFVVSDPAVSKANGLPGIVLAAAVKDGGGEFRGAFAYQMNLSQLSSVTGSIVVGKTGYGWIVDRNGIVIAHRDRKAIMALDITKADASGYRGLDAVAAKILSDESGTGEWIAPPDEEAGTGARAVTTYWARVPGDSGWTLGLSLPSSEVNETARSLVLVLVAILAVGVAASVAFSAALARRILAPLSLAAAGFRELAEGQADLTRRLDVRRDDEIGDLTRDFDTFIRKLAEIVGGLKSAQARLAAIGGELGASVGETAGAIARLGEGIGALRERAARQEESVAGSSGETERIARNVEAFDGLIEGEAAAITESSSAIEQMVGNIGAVGATIDKIAGEFGSLKGASEGGKAALAAAGERIAQIAQRSASLLEANAAIAGIASRTNLLAMNAAIEAAHAGSAGAGFSVVADEIRLLAENAARQSKTIGRELKAVQAAIAEVVQSSRSTEEAFSLVAGRIDLTDRLVGEARDAMDEQRQGSSQVLEALRDMNDLSSRVRTGSQEIRAGNSSLLGEMSRLRAIAAELRSSMDEMSAATSDLDRGARRVSAAAEGTRETILVMEGSIGRFKV